MNARLDLSSKLFKQLYRAQFSAVAATILDFTALIVCVELFGIWYKIGIVIGAFCGAMTNFVLGRHWTFEAAFESPHGQAIRYCTVACGSFILNWSGVVFFTEVFRVRYWFSKIVVACLVWFFNFFMQRGFVFRTGIRYRHKS